MIANLDKPIPTKRAFVSIGKIKHTPHNPPSRVTEQNLKKLIQSLDSIGLLHPITIDTNNIIIDGNRRFAAAKILKWKKIECNIRDADDSDLMYASVNSCSRNMSNAELLTVWLRNPKAVLASANKLFLKMQDDIGRPMMVRIQKEGYGPRLYRVAKEVAKYCSTDNIVEIVEWMLDVGGCEKLRTAVKIGESPRTILEAITKKKPVKFKLTVDE